jgi:hypothetical protein
MIKNNDSNNRRTIPSIATMTNKKRTTAELTDYSLKSVVTLQWHMNPKAKEDQIFQISINGETALIDLNELMSYTRLI